MARKMDGRTDIYKQINSLHKAYIEQLFQERVDGFLPSYPGNLRQISNWQHILHSQSSRKVQEYLDSNLQQIAQVYVKIYCFWSKPVGLEPPTGARNRRKYVEISNYGFFYWSIFFL